jgi:hypothetical protein
MDINKDMTPSRFLGVFGPALEEFLTQTYGKDGAYVLDLLPQAAQFFSVSFHALEAVQYAEYTSPKVDVAEEEAK